MRNNPFMASVWLSARWLSAWRMAVVGVLLAWPLGVCSAQAADSTDATAAIGADELVIDGIVVTHMGVGVSGAEVRIELPDATEGTPPLAQSLTGRRGEIKIVLKRPRAAELRYRVTAEGFADQAGEIDISDPDEPPFIDVTLQGASRLTGTIKHAAGGKPVSDAKVQLQNGGRRRTVLTGPDGGYAFDAVYLGPAMITVSSDGCGIRRERLELQENQLNLDLELAPERPIQLTIMTAAGKPAADVLIEVLTEPQQIHLSTRSDDQGQARLSGVPADATGLNLRLNGEDYLAMRGYDEHVPLTSPAEPAASQPAEVQAQFTEVRAQLTVTLAGRLRGKIVDAQTGKPVHNVRVLAGREQRYAMPMDWSGPSGVYELTGVEPGTTTITFQHDVYATLFRDIELIGGQTTTLDVSMEGGVALGGMVIDEEGLPVDQVRLVADQFGEYQTLGLRAITDSKGCFEFPHVPAGVIGFTLVRPGYGKPITLDLETGKTDHVITLPSAAVPLTTGAAPLEEARLAAGQPAPDLNLTATDGTNYKLSELRGKYVFLDCWASWCRPCIAEIPHIRELHAATQDRPDFVLIGISLDTDAKALKQACEEHRMVWPQVFGPRSGAAEAFEALDGVGIPYTCLIGPDGRIIAQHLRGPGLVDQVTRLLRETPPTGSNGPAR